MNDKVVLKYSNEDGKQDQLIMTMTNDKGESKDYEILMQINLKDSNKGYICYTDNSKTEDGEVQVNAAAYINEGNNEEFFIPKEIFPIEDEKEWDLIEMCLKNAQEQEKGDKNE